MWEQQTQRLRDKTIICMFLHCNLFYVIIFHFTPWSVVRQRLQLLCGKVICSSAALWSQLRRCVAACWVEAFLWLNMGLLVIIQ